MSAGYLIALASSVAVILSARLLVGSLPLRRLAVQIGAAEAVLAAIGIAGLAFHCGAMFFPATLSRIPGTNQAISDINALGAVSRIWYIAAVVLVLIGLRRQHFIVLVVVALALGAVGTTMYDGGPLRTHLVAIFGTVVILAGVAALLVRPPSPTHRMRLRRASA